MERQAISFTLPVPLPLPYHPLPYPTQRARFLVLATDQALEPTLEATQGQIDGFFSQPPFKCYLPEVAFCGRFTEDLPIGCLQGRARPASSSFASTDYSQVGMYECAVQIRHPWCENEPSFTKLAEIDCYKARRRALNARSLELRRAGGGTRTGGRMHVERCEQHRGQTAWDGASTPPLAGTPCQCSVGVACQSRKAVRSRDAGSIVTGR